MTVWTRLRSLLQFPTPIGRIPRSATVPRIATIVIAGLILAIDTWMIHAVRHAAYP